MEKNIKMIVEQEAGALMKYRDALGIDDKIVFDKLVLLAKNHAPACAHAKGLNLLESMLLAIVLEQQKVIERINPQEYLGT